MFSISTISELIAIFPTPPPHPPIHTAVMERLYNYVHPVTNKPAPMISKDAYDVIMKNADVS